MNTQPVPAGSGRAPHGALLVLCRTFPKLSETFVLGETLALQRAGYDVHVAALKAPDAAPMHAELAQLRRPPCYLPADMGGDARAADGLPSNVLELLHAAPEGVLQPALWLADIVRRERITHIHAHYIAETAWIAAVAARLASVPFSISAHAKDIYLGAPMALRRLLGEAAFTATCTGYNTRHLRALAHAPERVHCIHHGVDLAHFAPVSEAHGFNCNDARPNAGAAAAEPAGTEAIPAGTSAIPAGTAAIPADTAAIPLLLGVGRFREKKGFDVLIDACAHLHGQGVRLRCEIVGYGEIEPQLRARIREHGLTEVVTLVAPEPHQQLVQRLTRATLFALPCRIASDGDRDGIPNVVLEAMAMALPVVSTPVSGIPEVLSNDENGVLVPADDVQALARAIARLLADAPLRQRLGAAARTRVAEQFSWTTAAARLHAAIAGARQQGLTARLPIAAAIEAGTP